ncbi:MAG: hypothetical protein PHN60_00980 [Candidatus Gracilibacteria bacterium]|nr:hypothetical protein [Candidatus Gracilibacteria bacterium]
MRSSSDDYLGRVSKSSKALWTYKVRNWFDKNRETVYAGILIYMSGGMWGMWMYGYGREEDKDTTNN